MRKALLIVVAGVLTLSACQSRTLKHLEDNSLTTDCNSAHWRILETTTSDKLFIATIQKEHETGTRTFLSKATSAAGGFEAGRLVQICADTDVEDDGGHAVYYTVSFSMTLVPPQYDDVDGDKIPHSIYGIIKGWKP